MDGLTEGQRNVLEALEIGKWVQEVSVCLLCDMYIKKDTDAQLKELQDKGFIETRLGCDYLNNQVWEYSRVK